MVDEDRIYLRALLADLASDAAPWFPPGEEPKLNLVHPSLMRAQASTTGEASRLWEQAATLAGAAMWTGDPANEASREVWENVRSLTKRAAALSPTATPRSV